MESSKPSRISSFEQVGQHLFTQMSFLQPSGMLALGSIDSARVESRRQLAKLHPGNRFRLMFGLPLLPEEPESEASH